MMVFGRRPITGRAKHSGPAYENRQRTKPRERERERRRALPSYGDLRIARGVMKLARTRRDASWTAAMTTEQGGAMFLRGDLSGVVNEMAK